jgi:hypothetical protein
MNKIKDIINLAKDSLNQTIQLIKTIPILLAVPVIHFMAYFAVVNLGIFKLGMFSGLILTLVTAVILSSYLYVLQQAIYYKDYRLSYLYKGIKVMFLRTWFFLIIFNLVNYLIAMTSAASFMGAYASMIPFLLFNPMPEIIYISGYNERDMFFYNFNFLKRNYLPWYAINTLLLMGLMLLLLVGGLVVYIANMLLVIYLGFAMIFRGYLFKTLHTTNSRKRQFNRFNR